MTMIHLWLQGLPDADDKYADDPFSDLKGLEASLYVDIKRATQAVRAAYVERLWKLRDDPYWQAALRRLETLAEPNRRLAIGSNPWRADRGTSTPERQREKHVARQRRYRERERKKRERAEEPAG